MNPLISIIIPHRNSVTLLEKCLKSIPKSNDIQIIVVDDNSSNIKDIERIAKDDNQNIEFIFTNEGKGAGYARNIGLKRACGEWLLFSDADDFFTENAFNVIREYTTSECDMIVFKHKSIILETGKESIRSNYRNVFIDNYINEPSNNNDAFLRYGNNVPWAKLIRHSLVKNNRIYFDEVPASNDTMFSLLCGHYANKIKAVDIPIYVATISNGSITRTKSFERYESNHNVALRKNKFLRDINHPECQERILSRMIIVLRLYGLRSFISLLKSYFKYGGRLL